MRIGEGGGGEGGGWKIWLKEDFHPTDKQGRYFFSTGKAVRDIELVEHDFLFLALLGCCRKFFSKVPASPQESNAPSLYILFKRTVATLALATVMATVELKMSKMSFLVFPFFATTRCFQ